MKNTIQVIDDLLFQLKDKDPKDKVAEELTWALKRIVNIFVLDQDPHAFASEPKDLPPKIKAYPEDYSTKEIKQWEQDLLEWIPTKPIRLSDLIERCLNNLGCEVWEVYDSHIKGAVLSLNEEGSIEIDQDWDTWIKRVS